jgi:hypothetical protein
MTWISVLREVVAARRRAFALDMARSYVANF